MQKKNLLLQGFIMEVRKDIEIPPVLMDFLSEDDQGMEGLEFMLKDPKLCQRIPTGVRFNYESLYASIRLSLEDEISNARKALDKIEENPQDAIHSLIQALYESKK